MLIPMVPKTTKKKQSGRKSTFVSAQRPAARLRKLAEESL